MNILRCRYCGAGQSADKYKKNGNGYYVKVCSDCVKRRTIDKDCVLLSGRRREAPKHRDVPIWSAEYYPFVVRYDPDKPNIALLYLIDDFIYTFSKVELAMEEAKNRFFLYDGKAR